MTVNEENRVSEETRQRLDGARRGLLHLHKGLLDNARDSYEAIHRRSLTRGELLHLLVSDDWFAWLRPLSQLIVRIDEATDDKDNPLTEEGGQELLQGVRALISPGDSEDDFARKYRNALQEKPEIVMLHGTVAQFLPGA